VPGHDAQIRRRMLAACHDRVPLPASPPEYGHHDLLVRPIEVVLRRLNRTRDPRSAITTSSR
jgi:hypothetical protein